MATLEAPIIPVPDYTPAYNARIERLGWYSEREKADEVYRRGRRVEQARISLERAREMRRRDRANRERDARKARSNTLWLRREKLYGARYRAVADRIMAERKIRPPGKAIKSIRAYREKLNAALQMDAEYLALRKREERGNDFRERIRSRRTGMEFMAGCLAIDDRATRQAKVTAYRERPNSD